METQGKTTTKHTHKLFGTGDPHIPHSIHKIKPHRWKEQKELTKEDYLFFPGDFGLIFDYQQTGQSVASNENDKCWSREELFWLKWLEDRPFTTLFVDGNHENFDRLDTYPVTEDWNGGKVQIISESVIHLMRGEVYTINGNTIFVFGGAVSTDRGPATGTEERDIHKIWWPQECPSQKEWDNALKNLAAHGNEVDYIITHEAPSSFLVSRGMTPNKVSNYLENLWETVRFKRWFCGHHHIDVEYKKLRVLFNDIVPIESK